MTTTIGTTIATTAPAAGAAAARPGRSTPGRPTPEGSEPGFVSIWVLYWSLSVLFLAGFGLDLWRGVAVRRALQDQAEAAAAAGANGVSEDVFRQSGEIVIDPELANVLARSNLAAQDEADLVEGSAVSVDPATQQVTVQLSATVDFTLIRVFLPAEAPLVVDVSASAAPRIGAP